MNKKWEVCKIEEEIVNKICKENNLSTLLGSILVSKQVDSEEKIRLFLNPTREDFHDPFLMPDMEKAVQRILNAIKEQHKTIIYGDYDVDGITSVTVLKKYLEELGLEVGTYIPNRLNEGYGLNKEAVKKIADQGYTLIITVDCGISCIEEIEYANELGIEVIVTDHHEPGEEIPKCLAVIDAKRKDNHYPFNQLAGVGVVFKLIQAISIKLNLDAKEYLKYLDIVCVGTISDIVPLVDENRVITKLGLKLVERTKNIGLKTLLDSTGYKEINSTTISFGIAPRINACGRMGGEIEALHLFLTNDLQEAKQISEKLNKYNTERQEIEKQIFKQALELVENEEEKSCIVLGKEGWHHGIIGIVASKITDIYFKPSILICFEGKEGKGSGRSIPGFDLHDAVMNCNTYVERFGGHSMAIGINVKKENFEKFKKEFETYTQNSHINDIIPIIKIDREVDIRKINIQDIKDLKLLEPYGEANKMPLFLIKNLKIQAIRTLSEGKHIKLKLGIDNYIIDAIGFNMGNIADKYLIGDKVDVVGSLEINEFGGNENIQINLKDMRKTI